MNYIFLNYTKLTINDKLYILVFGHNLNSVAGLLHLYKNTKKH